MSCSAHAGGNAIKNTNVVGALSVLHAVGQRDA